MVSVLAAIGLGVIVGGHTLIAAILTRLFRVRLKTRWGAAFYTLLIVPAILLISTLVVSGVLGLGPDLGSPTAAVFVMVGVPLALGVTIDYFWMPAPEDVELPEAT